MGGAQKAKKRRFFAKPELEYGRFYATKPVGLGADGLKKRSHWKYDPNFWAARGTLRAWLEELQILSFQTAVGRRFEHLAARKNRRLSRKGSVRRGEARTQRWEAKAASSLCCS